jgi:hypothetical protein
VFEAAVEVSSRCRSVEAAVEVLMLLSRCEAAVEVLSSCKVPWRLTPFSLNHPVVLSAGIVRFVESEVLASLILPKAAVEASSSSRCRHSRGVL